MGIFDFFTKKKKVKTVYNLGDLHKSIEQYKKKEEQFKLLKKKDMPSIPDADLRQAVMNWMCNKFNKDWTDQYEVIESMPKPCQNVYACCTVSDEINNGGLNQLFFNSMEEFAEMARHGFIAIGNPELGRIMSDAISVFMQNVETLKKYNDGTAESFVASYDEHLFEQFDNDFYKEEPSFHYQLEAYIRKNQNYFGD